MSKAQCANCDGSGKLCRRCGRSQELTEYKECNGREPHDLVECPECCGEGFVRVSVR